MSTLITGDTHGDVRRLNNSDVKRACKGEYPDYVAEMGDFGLIWSTNPEDPYEKYWIKWLDEKPYITVATIGNHENYERIRNFPLVDFCEGKARQIGKKVFLLEHGEYYVIDGKRIFNFGGALSIDKASRSNRITWWQEEVPSMAEYLHAVDTLTKHPTVDYIFSHTTSLPTVKLIETKFPEKLLLASIPDKLKDATCVMLSSLEAMVTFDHNYFGHFHMNEQIDDKHTCLYGKLLFIE